MFCRLAAGLALLGAAAGAVEPWKYCAIETETVRRVPTPGGSFAPLFEDQTVSAYLARIGALVAAARSSQPVAVLLYYGKDPECFEGRRGVYMSTAFFLTASREDDLVAAVIKQLEVTRRARRRSVPTGSICADLQPSVGVEFADARALLESQLRRYEDHLRPRLKVRMAGSADGQDD